MGTSAPFVIDCNFKSTRPLKISQGNRKNVEKTAPFQVLHMDNNLIINRNVEM